MLAPKLKRSRFKLFPRYKIESYTEWKSEPYYRLYRRVGLSERLWFLGISLITFGLYAICKVIVRSILEIDLFDTDYWDLVGRYSTMEEALESLYYYEQRDNPTRYYY